MPRAKKIAVIGGGGKISSAVVYELLNDLREAPLELTLYGRNAAKLANTITLSDRFNRGNAEVTAQPDLDLALRGADIVFYAATYGHADYGGYRSMGVSGGALILAIAERMRELCPDAWFLVVTNPPDIPLAAAHMRFGLEKLIGLCNAPVFNRRMLASFFACPEEELSLHEIGVNHEYWYYDIRRGGVSVYDELRGRLPLEYEPSAMRGAFHDAFPEWRMGFVNNVELLRLSGFLSGPVGGSNRYRGLPVRLADMWAAASRPKDTDFEALLAPGLSNQQILEGTRRCAAGLPVYVAGVIESLVAGDSGQGKPAEHPVLALNRGSLPQYPDDVLLQMTCGVSPAGLTRPDLRAVPEYIHAVLASRILQNHLMAKSLAEQDEKLALQSLLVYPERIEGREADGFLQTHKSVEPFIQLD